jgi:hypothetical protein
VTGSIKYVFLTLFPSFLAKICTPITIWPAAQLQQQLEATHTGHFKGPYQDFEKDICTGAFETYGRKYMQNYIGNTYYPLQDDCQYLGCI